MKTSLKLISHVVSSDHSINEKTMFNRTRKSEVVKARQVFHYLARRLNTKSVSLSEIGRFGRIYKQWDHCSVLHSIKSVENQMDIYPAYKKNIDEIIEKIMEMKEKEPETKDINMIINNLKIMNHETLPQHYQSE